MLSVRELWVEIDGKTIISNLSLSIRQKELHALMGPNGSGKSSLSFALSGHPHYHVNSTSQIALGNQDMLPLLPQERAQQGLFLTFQHPTTIPGLSVQQLLKTSWDHLHPKRQTPVSQLRQQMLDHCQLLGINPEFLSRSIDSGFSGGEKKRLEMLQLLMAEPKIAILDEIDSGLDIDAIKIIAKAVHFAQEKYNTGFLIVTHYRRILDHIHPDHVHIMVKGNLVKSGGDELINNIEKNGYKHLL